VFFPSYLIGGFASFYFLSGTTANCFMLVCTSFLFGIYLLSFLINYGCVLVETFVVGTELLLAFSSPMYFQYLFVLNNSFLFTISHIDASSSLMLREWQQTSEFFNNDIVTILTLACCGITWH
jgi:hypothetical protein